MIEAPLKNLPMVVWVTSVVHNILFIVVGLKVLTFIRYTMIGAFKSLPDFIYIILGKILTHKCHSFICIYLLPTKASANCEKFVFEWKELFVAKLEPGQGALFLEKQSHDWMTLKASLSHFRCAVGIFSPATNSTSLAFLWKVRTKREREGKRSIKR